jgi:prolyl-tRNA synthetase
MLKTLVFRVRDVAQTAAQAAPVQTDIERDHAGAHAEAKAQGSRPLGTADNSRPENLAHPKWVVAVVRGSDDVNEAKLAQAAKRNFNVAGVELIDNPEVRAKWAIGFVGPDAAVKDPETVVLVDPDAAQGGFWATGANEVDYHVKHFNWFRESDDRLADPRKVAVADIRNAREGDPSPKNDGGVLKASKGIEIGHVFKLGTKYSDALGAKVDDAKGQSIPMIMGCYGIGVGRILIAAIESFHDERGIIWPTPIAPFSVVITPIKYEGEVQQTADRLYDQLNAAGIDTLLDDRDARPGSKFADADLIGFPVRINIGDRGLKEGKVELKRRRVEQPEMVPIDGAVDVVRAALALK